MVHGLSLWSPYRSKRLSRVAKLMIALAANATPMTMAACRTIEPQFMGMPRGRRPQASRAPMAWIKPAARPIAGSDRRSWRQSRGYAREHQRLGYRTELEFRRR